MNTKVDFISTTLGKALGGATGGYLASSKEVVSVLRNKARTYLFSNSVAPPVVAASLHVMDMLEQRGDAREQLRENTHYMRNSLADAGLTILGHDDCPIVPLFCGFLLSVLTYLL